MSYANRGNSGVEVMITFCLVSMMLIQFFERTCCWHGLGQRAGEECGAANSMRKVPGSRKVKIARRVLKLNNIITIVKPTQLNHSSRWNTYLTWSRTKPRPDPATTLRMVMKEHTAAARELFETEPRRQHYGREEG